MSSQITNQLDTLNFPDILNTNIIEQDDRQYIDRSMFPDVHIQEIPDSSLSLNLTHVRFSVSHIRSYLNIARIMIYQYQGIPNFTPSLATVQNLIEAVNLKVLDPSVEFLDIDRNIYMYDPKESIYSFFVIFINNKNEILQSAGGPYIKYIQGVRLKGSTKLPSSPVNTSVPTPTVTTQTSQLNVYISDNAPPLPLPGMLWVDTHQSSSVPDATSVLAPNFSPSQIVEGNTSIKYIDKFTGDGVQTNFTMSYAVSSASSILIFINGLMQIADTDYTVNNKTLILLSPLQIDDTLTIIHFE